MWTAPPAETIEGATDSLKAADPKMLAAQQKEQTKRAKTQPRPSITAKPASMLAPYSTSARPRN